MQSFFLIRLFVYGKEESIHSLEDVELQVNPEDKKIHSEVPKDDKVDVAKVLKLAYCFIGLQCSFLAWGLLQEKIMTTEYTVRSVDSTKGIKNCVQIVFESKLFQFSWNSSNCD